MKAYYLNRKVDQTGNSGTGLVAEVVDFDEGFTVVHWSIGSNALGVSSTVVYRSLEDAVRVHGHNGATTLVEDPGAEGQGRHMTDSSDWTFRDGTQVWVTPAAVTVVPPEV